jgi:glycosyltransferase involved in cell wall biosynthesis
MPTMSEFSTKGIISSCNTMPKKQYNILTFPTHERYETQLAKTGHNFYSFNLPNMKKWNSEQISVPENYYIMPESDTCSYIEYDFILSQSKFWQFQAAKQIQKVIKVPIISLEHTVPTPPAMTKEQIEYMRNMVGDINVFISEYSKNEWNVDSPNSYVVHHGLSTAEFMDLNLEREDHVLTVANDFINRDYCLNYSGWKRVTDGIKTKLIGDTKGLSKAAESTAELILEYNKCSVYFNSSTLSPIPTSLLEAMSCGCVVVSTATCMIPEIIENGVNGFISNDEHELRSRIEFLISNKEARLSMGKKARETILSKFPETNFVNNWNRVFDQAHRITIK